jgi:hypothetical protein
MFAVEKSISRAKRYVTVSANLMRNLKRNANRSQRHVLKNKIRDCIAQDNWDDTMPHKLPKLTSWDIC